MPLGVAAVTLLRQGGRGAEADPHGFGVEDHRDSTAAVLRRGGAWSRSFGCGRPCVPDRARTFLLCSRGLVTVEIPQVQFLEKVSCPCCATTGDSAENCGGSAVAGLVGMVQFLNKVVDVPVAVHVRCWVRDSAENCGDSASLVEGSAVPGRASQVKRSDRVPSQVQFLQKIEVTGVLVGCNIRSR